MSTRTKILEILENSENWISGEEIGRNFQISRNSVSKHIKQLKENGYQIESMSKKGYRLLVTTDKTLPEEIKKDLNTRIIGQNDIFYFEEIDSTNNKAKELASNGVGEGTVVIADKQTSGRGRKGRFWVSPLGTGLYFSIILKPDLEPSEAPKITLTAAVALHKTLSDLYGIKITIKWPNDILINQRKTAGILTEISADIDSIHYVVLGIGLNVNTEKFPSDIDNISTSLLLESNEIKNRNIVLKKIFVDFEYYYQKLLNKEFSEILDEWKKHSNILGKQVEVSQIHKTLTGKIVDMDSDGFLILEENNGKITQILSGDVKIIS